MQQIIWKQNMTRSLQVQTDSAEKPVLFQCGADGLSHCLTLCELYTALLALLLCLPWTVGSVGKDLTIPAGTISTSTTCWSSTCRCTSPAPCRALSARSRGSGPQPMPCSMWSLELVMDAKEKTMQEKIFTSSLGVTM